MGRKKVTAAEGPANNPADLAISADRATTAQELKKEIKDLDDLFSRFPSGEVVTKIDTGSISLNRIFGGGYPLGKYIQMYSDEGLGKTTIALTIAKALADNGYYTVYLDVEKALNAEILDGMEITPYVRQDGESIEEILANNRKIFIHKLDTFTEIEAIMQFYIKMQQDMQKKGQDFRIGTFVFDSLTALLTESLMEKNIEEATIGVKARLQGALLEKYKSFMYANQISIILLNQKRMKIGTGWGEITKAVAAGGYALRFYSDIIISLDREEWIQRADKQIIGAKLKMMADKNKFVAPKLVYPIHIIFGKGVSNVMTVADTLVKDGKIRHSGSYWYPVSPEGEELKIQGEKEYRDWVKDNLAYAVGMLQ
jgi:recombination protein RecA